MTLVRYVPALKLILIWMGLLLSASPANAAESASMEITKGHPLFKTITAFGIEEGAEVSWVLDYSLCDAVETSYVVIKYNTEIGQKREAKGMESSWSYTDPIPATETHTVINDLIGNEKYIIYLGFSTSLLSAEQDLAKADIAWSDKVKVETMRGWGLLKFLILFGSLGLFIFGMKTMSDGLQRASSTKLRQMLGSITSNRVKGVLTGFFSTAIVQSSSVTTVMTVSLVNAGLLNLRQSAGVMMGANIGTTITAWLVLLLGFKVDISDYALMLIAFGAPLLFMSFSKSKEISSSIIGFALLFIGLQALKDSVPNLDKDSAIVQFFINYQDIPVLSNVMFVLLGALVTIVIQSSSAAMALTLTLVSKGIIPFDVACAMVLGENIGTTITAEIASSVGNVHAKRSARIHSLFNIIGVTWMLIVFPWFTSMIGFLVGGDNFSTDDYEMANSGIALFHTMFNLSNVVLLIWFVPQLVSMAERTVKSKGDSDEEFNLKYIGSGVVSYPGLGLLEAKKEIARFGAITGRMVKFIRTLLNDPTKKEGEKMIKKISKYEEITDRFEVEITQYLERLAKGELTEANTLEVRSMLSIINDLERIGDIFFQMSKSMERKREEKIYFDPKQREQLNSMLDKVVKAFELMNINLEMDYLKVDLKESESAEKSINALRNDLRRKYQDRIAKGDQNIQGSMIYNDIFSQCEKIGDHIMNVNEAIVGQI
jgi:phosphate:Na+ symporter